MDKSKYKKWVIPSACGLCVLAMLFGTLSIYHYRYQNYHAEHVRIVRAQHQTNINIMQNNKK